MSADSLSFRGAQWAVGTTTASTVSMRMSNSGGAIDLAAAPTAVQTVWAPGGNGTLGLVTAIEAGTQTASTGAAVYSNSNNVSFGMSGSLTVTASAAAAQSNVPNIAAGTQTATIGTVIFSNSNNVSFGLNGQTLTASASFSQSTVPSAIAAGTQTATSGTVVFSNSNGVSFGMDTNGNVTAIAGTTGRSITVSALGSSANLSAVVFSNSNGVSFGLNASTITAVGPGLFPSDGVETAMSGTLVFANSNGFSFGMSTGHPNATVTALLYVSSFEQGQPTATFGLNSTAATTALSVQPFQLDYNINVTNVVLLAAMSGVTSVSGAFSLTAAIFTINGGTAGTLSLASSVTRVSTWTSGQAYSSASGTQYIELLPAAAWAMTPGPYVFALKAAMADSASLSLYAPQITVSLASVPSPAQVLPGYLTTFGGMPTSVAISDSAAYVRTGTVPFNQPYFVLEGS